MAFNSLTYVVFLTVAALLYWRLAGNAKLLLLLICGAIFYGMWRFDFLPLLFGTIIFDYFVGLQLGRDDISQPNRRRLLIASIFVNLGALCFFKYANFVLDNVNWLSSSAFGESLGLHLDVILPFGISFYIFHSLSYTIDVYRGVAKAERNFLLFADFVIFFPQLVAGPILRSREVMPQLAEKLPFRSEDLAYGIRRILYGFFLKCVLADNIADWVDVGFSAPAETMGALDVWAVGILFGWQIYFDFSGYSHIAIGSARILGIRFPENFNFPYVAANPKEFWTRWHISLSSWVRDYLYLPLCGMRGRAQSSGGLNEAVEERSSTRTWPLILTWGIMGLWHGANWTYVIWGLWHALIILVYRLCSATRLRVPQVVAIALTQLAVTIGWVAFRAQDAQTALTMVGKVFTPSAYLSRNPLEASGWVELARSFNLSMAPNVFLIAAGVTAGFYAWYLLTRKVDVLRESPAGLPANLVVCGFTALLFFFDFVFLRPNEVFIYFQF